jgi:hypothetical protein
MLPQFVAMMVLTPSRIIVYGAAIRATLPIASVNFWPYIDIDKQAGLDPKRPEAD